MIGENYSTCRIVIFDNLDNELNIGYKHVYDNDNMNRLNVHIGGNKKGCSIELNDKQMLILRNWLNLVVELNV